MSICKLCKLAKKILEMDGSKVFANDRIVLAVAWARGGRDYMQDAFSVNLTTRTKDGPLDFFGVFDGHGPNGENVSKFVAYKICQVVERQYDRTAQTFPQAIESACLLLDERLRKTAFLKDETGRVPGGTTCNAVWVKGRELHSCNLGDSRFVVAYDGRAVAVTDDHRATRRTEMARVYRAGGHVVDARVNGILSVTRAFGDFAFKSQRHLGPHEQLVSALPDVRTVDVDEHLDFMLVASDGVWDAVTNEEAIDFVIRLMKRAVPLPDICKRLIEACTVPVDPLLGIGSDNMTVIIALFRE